MRFASHPEPGYEGEWWAVEDTVTDEMLATRPRPQTAAWIANRLNARYPETAPAFDTLVHEIRMDRIGGIEI